MSLSCALFLNKIKHFGRNNTYTHPHTSSLLGRSDALETAYHTIRQHLLWGRTTAASPAAATVCVCVYKEQETKRKHTTQTTQANQFMLSMCVCEEGGECDGGHSARRRQRQQQQQQCSLIFQVLINCCFTPRRGNRALAFILFATSSLPPWGRSHHQLPPYLLLTIQHVTLATHREKKHPGRVASQLMSE